MYIKFIARVAVKVRAKQGVDKNLDLQNETSKEKHQSVYGFSDYKFTDDLELKSLYGSEENKRKQENFLTR
ncbi:CLUMA_CG005796, isoform A [Clunio marinus]|uniref:CLUMA_CG005796, isoform A n=1 Tax=Clunio marinus TaxID=568069 RepID=A0A1J1HW07_9DIPT|nr:CLUMA_CG005796, isoform A [Clunio marinus]